MKEKAARILYETADFHVEAASFGKSEGYAVYQGAGTHAVRVASIGYAGSAGLSRAMAEADRRAGLSVYPTAIHYSAPAHVFIGGFEIDPSQPATCQICERHIDEHKQ